MMILKKTIYQSTNKKKYSIDKNDDIKKENLSIDKQKEIFNGLVKERIKT